MINKAKKLWRKARPKIVASDGFLTKTGELVNYKEVHAYGIGIYDGTQNPSKNYLDRLSKVRQHSEDVDDQPHYFKLGFAKGQSLYFKAGLLLVAAIGLAVFYTSYR